MALMKARNELWLLTFFAFGVNYMLRININIAIVDMVAPTKNQPEFAVCEYDNKVNQSQRGVNFHNCTSNTRFSWDEYEQNLILSSYFWPHWILQFPGGMFAHYYGTKHTLGFNNLLCAVITFFIPLAASFGFRSLFILRAVQGFIAGSFWPSMPPLVAKWIPPKERGTFVSSYLGSSVGTAFTYFLCGVIIDWYGWQYVFYVTGALGIIWWIFWVTRVYDTPQKHPWISKEERDYIERCLGGAVNRKKLPIPWKKILTSRVVWMNAITQWGLNGTTFALLTHTPTYLKYIHHLPIQSTGLWSGVPHLTKWLVAVSFGLMAERQNCLSLTNVRKLATALASIPIAIIFYVLAFSECDTIVAVILLMLANSLQGTTAAGPLASVIDMSPNFSGVLQGLIGMVGVTPGFICPVIVGYLTRNNQTSAQWQKFFFIISTSTLICGMLYMCCGTSEIQPWNSEKNTEEELNRLHKGEYPQMLKYEGEIKKSKEVSADNRNYI